MLLSYCITLSVLKSSTIFFVLYMMSYHTFVQVQNKEKEKKLKI